MATVIVYTAARMKEIEDSAIIKGDIVGDELFLTRYNGAQINAGIVRGEKGIQGNVGPAGPPVVVTSTTRPNNPVAGMMIYETDTNKLYIWDGTTWNLPKNVEGGLIGPPGVRNFNSTGQIIAEVDLANLTTTVTVGNGRRIKVSYEIQTARTVPDGNSILRVREGTTELRGVCINHPVANAGETKSGNLLLTPTVGVHTYKLTLARLSGTGYCQIYAGATYPATIYAEDIGGV